MTVEISLKNYLGKTKLMENLKLTNSTSFHWSNWDQTCLLQKEHYKNFNRNLHLSELNNTLLELKEQPVWLCNKIQTKVSNLYALYESYLDSRLRLTWFERKNEILFSFESEHGPYYTLTSMKWFNKELYAQFVMRKILLEQFTLRTFRLNAEIPVIFKFDNDVKEYHNIVSIHQLTEAGIMLKIADKNFLNKMKNSYLLDCQIPIGIYANAQGLNILDTWKKLDEDSIIKDEDFRTYKLEAKVLNYYGNQLNAQKSGEKEFYIFALYEDLRPFGHETFLQQVLKPLVEKTKKHFLKDLEIMSLTDGNDKQVA